jgi:hypothetical protein
MTADDDLAFGADVEQAGAEAERQAKTGEDKRRGGRKRLRQ